MRLARSHVYGTFYKRGCGIPGLCDDGLRHAFPGSRFLWETPMVAVALRVADHEFPGSVALKLSYDQRYMDFAEPGVDVETPDGHLLSLDSDRASHALGPEVAAWLRGSTPARVWASLTLADPAPRLYKNVVLRLTYGPDLSPEKFYRCGDVFAALCVAGLRKLFPLAFAEGPPGTLSLLVSDREFNGAEELLVSYDSYNEVFALRDRTGDRGWEHLSRSRAVIVFGRDVADSIWRQRPSSLWVSLTEGEVR